MSGTPTTPPLATIADHNAAFDPADEALGGAFRAGFREGWIHGQSPDGTDYGDLAERYPQAVDIEPSEAWQAHRDEFFAMLPLAAIPEVGQPLPLDSHPAAPGSVREAEAGWSLNPDTRDIECGNAPVFRVYEADDFPCIEDEDRAKENEWFDAQAQTAVLMLNNLLHANGDNAAAPTPDGAASEVERLVDYLFGTDRNNDGPRVVDLCFTAFMSRDKPNPEDGGKSDWFTDTKPNIDRCIAVMKDRLRAALTTQGGAEG